MISVRLDKEMEKELEALSKLTKRPKSFFVKEALREYLEDIKDLLIAQERMSAPDREVIDLQELKKELGLDL